ncbi:hypothetical protein JW592_31240 [Streptomyces sp. DW4-2]|uniref:Uncharacterized protein n=2 Tax=Streptomyces spirodelae TaxID=2812904 RepID=A0ABS3X3D3_9ACTN|nr:hypothetical protein [Streptomyces spirodelae]
MGIGFPNSGVGAVSAAVHYWQDLDVLDDSIARRQLKAVSSPDSPEVVSHGVSRVRKTRETAGLAPSGSTPAGMSITTEVQAVRSRSLNNAGTVVEVWLVYDRYASLPEKPTDEDPLKGEEQRLIVKWQDGDWKLTEEARYVNRKTHPLAYDPKSPYAFRDGWRQVAHD